MSINTHHSALTSIIRTVKTYFRKKLFDSDAGFFDRDLSFTRLEYRRKCSKSPNAALFPSERILTSSIK